MVRTDKSRTGFELTNNEKYSVQHMKSHELEQKAKTRSTGLLELQRDSDETVEAVREDHELEKVERDMKTEKDSLERGNPLKYQNLLKMPVGIKGTRIR